MARKRYAPWKSPFGEDVARAVTASLDLTPWVDVQEVWNMVSGETISVDRVRQICCTAEAKLRAGFPDLEGFLDAR